MRNVLIMLVASLALIVGSVGTVAAAGFSGSDNPSSNPPTDCASALGVAGAAGAPLPSAAECP
jgi:hypothetical protein